MVNKPLIRPYFWGGTLRGGRLTSHEKMGASNTFKYSHFPLPWLWEKEYLLSGRGESKKVFPCFLVSGPAENRSKPWKYKDLKPPPRLPSKHQLEDRNLLCFCSSTDTSFPPPLLTRVWLPMTGATKKTSTTKNIIVEFSSELFSDVSLS